MRRAQCVILLSQGETEWFLKLSHFCIHIVFKGAEIGEGEANILTDVVKQFVLLTS